MPLQRIVVDCSIEGPTARLNLDLTYINSNKDEPIECTYVFPLEATTLISKFKATIDDRVIETKIADKEKA